jgi:prepilin-type N-terminal cleavage/methylation domain-containing protein
MTRRSGFSLAELVIATTIVAVTASVAIPAAQSRRILTNEACAVVALRDIASAQARFQAAKFVDVNQDGVGEFGMLRELSGAVGLRTIPDAYTQGSVLAPPVLPHTFAVHTTRRSAGVARAGYFLQIVLPSAGGLGVVEPNGTASLVTFVDSQLAATTWGCYAWPQRYGATGNQTFFANQTGDIVATESREYSGRYAVYMRNVGAAFVAGGPVTNITGQLAIGTVGRDGNVWRLVTPRAEEQGVAARGTLFGWHGRRRGSFEIKSQPVATSTHETLVIRAFALSPGRRYEIDAEALDSATNAHFGSVLAGADGGATFRFDSRSDAYPDGLQSLTRLIGGRLYLHWSTQSAGDYLSGRVPEFERADDSSPRAVSVESNEERAIAALRTIAAAQESFRASRAVGIWWDAPGEYGLLRELTGLIGVRTVSDASTVGSRLDPPLLDGSFATFRSLEYERVHGYRSLGQLRRAGYVLRVFLPGWTGIGIPEIESGALAANISGSLAETTWGCYAWPERYGATGRRAFFINQSGDIVATDVGTYSGTGTFVASNAGAAFAAGGALTNITGQVATGTRGRDGNLWRLVPSRPDEHDFVASGTMTAPASAATGTFVVESRLLTNDTIETMDVSTSQLDASTTYRVVLTDATHTSVAEFGATTGDAHGAATFRFDGRSQALPDGVSSVTAFGGGTIDVMSGDTVVLRGVLPAFATIGGARVPDSSVVFHVAKPLDAAPNQLPRHGSLDVRVTNAPEGTREELTVDVTTYDRDADPYGVFAVDDLGVATPLGTIAVRGLRGTGTLSLDTARGDVIAGGGLVALSGARIEVRTPTGFVVLTAVLPVVQ